MSMTANPCSASRPASRCSPCLLPNNPLGNSCCQLPSTTAVAIRTVRCRHQLCNLGYVTGGVCYACSKRAHGSSWVPADALLEHASVQVRARKGPARSDPGGRHVAVWPIALRAGWEADAPPIPRAPASRGRIHTCLRVHEHISSEHTYECAFKSATSTCLLRWMGQTTLPQR